MNIVLFALITYKKVLPAGAPSSLGTTLQYLLILVPILSLLFMITPRYIVCFFWDNLLAQNFDNYYKYFLQKLNYLKLNQN